MNLKENLGCGRMTRKYMNDRWCVRCGRNKPTPYLHRNAHRLVYFLPVEHTVLDLGCGNGRNTTFLRSLGVNCVGVDMVGDFGIKLTLGKEPLPAIYTGKISAFLLNYSVMFLDENEREFLYRDIARCASPRCMIFIELYPAKDSYCPTTESMHAIHTEIKEALCALGFSVIDDRLHKKSTHMIVQR